jgi:hypothetical protein
LGLIVRGYCNAIARDHNSYSASTVAIRRIEERWAKTNSFDAISAVMAIIIKFGFVG